MGRENKYPHRYQSIEALKKHFSEYLTLEEMEIILLDRTKAVKHLEGKRVDEAHLDFIQSCAEVMEFASELKTIGF